jgi:glycosyltransferase involved in cell wall biosynthesis
MGAFASEISPVLDMLPLRAAYPRSKSVWSPAWYSAVNPLHLKDVEAADVIFLHWVPRGLLSIGDVGRLLQLGKPVIWRLSDMWPFTGGCHYSGDCDGFMRSCGRCPQLESRWRTDLSSLLLQWKKRSWKSGNLTVVAPSDWIAEKARMSSLFQHRKVRVIRTGIDITIFRPFDKATAREILRLPQDVPLVLYGATNALTDPRKGGNAAASAFLLALESCRTDLTRPAMVVFGASTRPAELPAHAAVYPMGVIRDDRLLALVYSACDIFVAPSKEENLANSVIEAMACGLPCVAFDVGGMPEAIQHLQTGFLAPPGDVVRLAEAIRLFLEDAALRAACSVRARQRAERQFSLSSQSAEYVQMLREVVDA